MNIAFHSNQISERGTETAIFDYALGNQRILQNQSVLAVPGDKILCRERYDYFKRRMPVLLYSSKEELIQLLADNHIDLFYTIQDGGTPDHLTENFPMKTFIHCVFSTANPHGTFYCPIHKYLNIWGHTRYPVLPHMVKPHDTTAKTLREELQIPETAAVFGGYGGRDSFNIPFAREAVTATANNNPDIYFIFMNFENFTQSKNIRNRNIIFLPGSTDNTVKEIFINTCDAMIHARKDGETFGLAVAEFAAKNKPVITFKHPVSYLPKKAVKWFLHKKVYYKTAHLMNLKGKAITYHNYASLFRILNNFQSFYNPRENYNTVTDIFSEDNVMHIFNSIITKRGV